MGLEDYYFKKLLKLFFRNAEVITEADVPSGNLRIDFLFIKEKGIDLDPPLDFTREYSILVGEYKSFKDVFSSHSITSLIIKGLLLLDTALKGKIIDHKKMKHKTSDNNEKTKVLDNNKIMEEKHILTKKASSILANSLNTNDYCLILFLGGNHRLNNNVMNVFNDFKVGTCFKKLSNGIYGLKKEEKSYSCTLGMDFYVIVLEELPETDEYLAFKFFSNPEKREKIIKKAILNNDEFIYTLALYFNSELVIALEKSVGITLSPTPESIRKGVEILGLEKVIDAVGIEKVIEAVGLEKVIDAVGIEKVIEAVGIETTFQYLLSRPEKIKKLPPKIKEELKKLLI